MKSLNSKQAANRQNKGAVKRGAALAAAQALKPYVSKKDRKAAGVKAALDKKRRFVKKGSGVAAAKGQGKAEKGAAKKMARETAENNEGEQDMPNDNN